jgi:hypothetical protein
MFGAFAMIKRKHGTTIEQLIERYGLARHGVARRARHDLPHRTAPRSL